MPEFDDKTAIVTGASGGIGEAAAKRFAAEGASVVVADLKVEEGEATVADIEDAGGEATFVETDVSDPADAGAMVDVAVDTYGGLDFAFNNAGIEGERAATSDQPVDNFERVIGVNLKGVFLGMRAEIPVMLDDGGGAVVNTSSIAGRLGFPEISPYVASKFGVIGLTKTAALEYSGEGVRVNAVCPGVIDTPMVQRSQDDDPEMMEQTAAATPIGRIGEPAEIGDAAVWLCSEDASFVTGEAMTIDGGYTSQ
ncbi:glucose 1-dehydrogenase [Halosimplex rubrum]|uniref:Glucose 1-dehydrogenase n=1 Tax=Halosimplex rubrum TaxID=869889 RepID=A0A7D5P2F6_9EURY|nr:glucose 1-dehydrogenase [Halosimplex rubrum]QLH75785.1 glucose 1-dehydrogenase [Halosimplex rubrum]